MSIKEGIDQVIEDEYCNDDSIDSKALQEEENKPENTGKRGRKKELPSEFEEENLQFKIDKLFSKSRTDEGNGKTDKSESQNKQTKLRTRFSETELKKKSIPFGFNSKRTNNNTNSRVKTSINSKSNSSLKIKSYRLKRRETVNIATPSSQESKINVTKQLSLKNIKTFDEFIGKTKGLGESMRKPRKMDKLNLSLRTTNLKVFNIKKERKYKNDHK